MKYIMMLSVISIFLLAAGVFSSAKAVSTICGDADGSGAINLLDVSYIINYLYRSGPKPDPMKSADVDNSNKINLLDVSYIISNLYRGGPKPVCSNYLGLIPPDSIPIVFAPGIVSNANMREWGCTFDPLLQEFYFTRCIDRQNIMGMKRNGAEWSAPSLVSFSRPYADMEPLLNYDGTILYFCSYGPCTDCYYPIGFNTWHSHKSGSNWSTAHPPDEPLKSIGGMYTTTSLNGNMYFMAITTLNPGVAEIYCSKFTDGQYQTPERLGAGINNGYDVMHPCISPDESYILFDANNRPDGYGTTNLYISFKKSDGSWTQSINLGSRINDTTSVWCPSLSPDGKYLFYTRIRGDDTEDIYWCDTKFIDKLRQGILKIAFITYRYNIVTNEICVMNADGTRLQRLTDDPANKDTPSFSPNGKEIAYSTEPDGSEEHQIFIIKSDGSSTRQITNGGGHAYCPDWSPDGTKIAYNRYNSSYTTSDIFIVDIGSGLESQLTSNSGQNTAPDWFPGGDSLLFLSSRGGTYRLYIMNSDGTNQHAIGDPAMGTTGGRVSPDGTKIAYDYVVSWSPVPYRNEIHLMNSDGTGDIALTAAGGINERADWSPDGEQIVFQSDRDGIMKIYVMKPDGSDVRLLSAGNEDYCPTWGIVGAAPNNSMQKR